MIPRAIFELGLFAAYAGVGLGTLYLVVVLIREWWRGELW